MYILYSTCTSIWLNDNKNELVKDSFGTAYWLPIKTWFSYLWWEPLFAALGDKPRP